MSSVDVVKLSDEDAAWLNKGSAGSSTTDWLADGVAAVVTTAGAAGITVRTAAGEVTAPAPAVDVVDTIEFNPTFDGPIDDSAFAGPLTP